MSLLNSDKAQISFRDVAACFSEEEWKLLHEWQKELYKNVMKEIHQALISLGPLIATSVFSLSAVEKEDLCHAVPQAPERRCTTNRSQSTMNIHPDVSFRINRDDIVHLKNPQDTKGRERIDRLSTGEMNINPDVSSRINRDEILHLKNPQDTKGRERNDHLSTGFPFVKNLDICLRKEEELSARLMDHIATEGGENSIHPSPAGFPFLDTDFSMRNEDKPSVSLIGHRRAEEEHSTDPSSGRVVSPDVVFVCIKDEQETYPMDNKDSEVIGTTSNLTGDGSMKRQKKVAVSTQRGKKAPPCKASSGKISTKVFQSSQRVTQSRSQLWPESYQEMRAEQSTRCESGFSSSEHFHLHQERTKVGISHQYNECESNPRTPVFLNDLPNTQQNQTPYTCTECDKSYSRKGELITHMATHSIARPYACTHCEKSFFQKPNLIKHLRTHSGEKPYTCTFCHKTFSRKDNLNGHMRIHSGERPYKCTECEKSFTWKGDLNQHRRRRHLL